MSAFLQAVNHFTVAAGADWVWHCHNKIICLKKPPARKRWGVFAFCERLTAPVGPSLSRVALDDRNPVYVWVQTGGALIRHARGNPQLLGIGRQRFLDRVLAAPIAAYGAQCSVKQETTLAAGRHRVGPGSFWPAIGSRKRLNRRLM